MDPMPTTYSGGDNPFVIKEAASEYTLLDFWSWAFSDVLTNTIRGMLAEFIIALALGIDLKNHVMDGQNLISPMEIMGLK
jgi:hypothetical protein